MTFVQHYYYMKQLFVAQLLGLWALHNEIRFPVRPIIYIGEKRHISAHSLLDSQ